MGEGSGIVMAVEHDFYRLDGGSMTPESLHAETERAIIDAMGIEAREATDVFLAGDRVDVATDAVFAVLRKHIEALRGRRLHGKYKEACEDMLALLGDQG